MVCHIIWLGREQLNTPTWKVQKHIDSHSHNCMEGIDSYDREKKEYNDNLEVTVQVSGLENWSCYK